MIFKILHGDGHYTWNELKYNVNYYKRVHVPKVCEYIKSGHTFGHHTVIRTNTQQYSPIALALLIALVIWICLLLHKPDNSIERVKYVVSHMYYLLGMYTYISSLQCTCRLIKAVGCVNTKKIQMMCRISTTFTITITSQNHCNKVCTYILDHINTGFKIMFRKMLKFAGFLGVAHFVW
jgi:hypothetical protein